MSNYPGFTDHARLRAQQRGIPPLIDEWLDRFGVEDYDGRGGVRRYFSRRSIRDMERAFGREPVRLMERYLNIYKVESSKKGCTITTAHKTKRFRRK